MENCVFLKALMMGGNGDMGGQKSKRTTDQLDGALFPR